MNSITLVNQETSAPVAPASTWTDAPAATSVVVAAPVSTSVPVVAPVSSAVVAPVSSAAPVVAPVGTSRDSHMPAHTAAASTKAWVHHSTWGTKAWETQSAWGTQSWENNYVEGTKQATVKATSTVNYVAPKNSAEIAASISSYLKANPTATSLPKNGAGELSALSLLTVVLFYLF